MAASQQVEDIGLSLLGQYDSLSANTDNDVNSAQTSFDEFNNYLAACETGIQLPCLQFWHQNKSYKRLKELAIKFLVVPTTSAPVERVFSADGMFMRPHRARLSNQNTCGFNAAVTDSVQH